MIEAGTKGHIEAIVTSEMTARAIGSGELEVLATPKLAALIEEAAWRSVSSALDEGQTTVGTKLELSHLAPTPTGMQLSCDTTLAQKSDLDEEESLVRARRPARAKGAREQAHGVGKEG